MSQPLYASTEQLIDAGDPRGTASGIALGASLLLHLGIIGLIFFRQSETKLPEGPPAKVAMVVSLTCANPQLELPSPAGTAGIDASNSGLETSTGQPIAETEPAEERTTAEQTSVSEQPPASTTIAPASEFKKTNRSGMQ